MDEDSYLYNPPKQRPKLLSPEDVKALEQIVCRGTGTDNMSQLLIRAVAAQKKSFWHSAADFLASIIPASRGERLAQEAKMAATEIAFVKLNEDARAKNEWASFQREVASRIKGGFEARVRRAKEIEDRRRWRDAEEPSIFETREVPDEAYLGTIEKAAEKTKNEINPKIRWKGMNSLTRAEGSFVIPRNVRNYARSLLQASPKQP